MYATFLLRCGSQTLSAVLGGMAVFCVYYAVLLGDPKLLILVVKFGGPAIAIVYCQSRYLS
jgi:hypothetical protein